MKEKKAAAFFYEQLICPFFETTQVPSRHAKTSLLYYKIALSIFNFKSKESNLKKFFKLVRINLNELSLKCLIEKLVQSERFSSSQSLTDLVGFYIDNLDLSNQYPAMIQTKLIDVFKLLKKFHDLYLIKRFIKKFAFDFSLEVCPILASIIITNGWSTFISSFVDTTRPIEETNIIFFSNLTRVN